MKIVYSLMFFFVFISWSLSQDIIDKLPVEIETPKVEAEDFGGGYRVPAPPALPSPPPLSSQSDYDLDYIHHKVDVEAEYPGGLNSLREFICSNIKYPEKALDKGIRGRVMLKFVVEKDGSVSHITILKDIGIGDGFGQEAVRVLKHTSGSWIPARVNDIPVRSYYYYPVEFKLPES